MAIPVMTWRLIFENNDVMPRWLPSEHVELNVEEDVLTVELAGPDAAEWHAVSDA